MVPARVIRFGEGVEDADALLLSGDGEEDGRTEERGVGTCCYDGADVGAG